MPEFAEQFVLKSRRTPTLPDLYNHDNLTLSYPELLEKCGEVRVPLSDSDIDLVEHTQESNHMELHSSNIELEELEPQPVILLRTQILPSHLSLLLRTYVTLSYLGQNLKQ